MLGVWRLQLLREVARRGTIRAAAAAMSITPSAVSQQLRILETEAGVPLLEPHGRLVRLTDAGDMLVRHADTITAAIVAAESELATTLDEVSGTLRIAAFPTAARALLPGVIAQLGRAHPRLRVTLRDLETAESLVALRLDEVDLAVLDEYPGGIPIREPGIEIIPVLEDPLLVALPPDIGQGPGLDTDPGTALEPAPVAAGEPGFARIAGAASRAVGAIRLETLSEASWIMDTETSTIHAAVMRHCRQAGFEPQVRSNCRDYSVIIALVEAGLGVAVLPGLALRDRNLRARLALLEPALYRRVLVGLKPERRGHPAVAALLGALRQIA